MTQAHEAWIAKSEGKCAVDYSWHMAITKFENEDKAALGDLRHRVDTLSVVTEGDEIRRRGQIAIPEVVVYRLKVPESSTRARIEGEERVREEIRANAFAPVEVRSRRARRDVHNPSSRVD